MKVKDLIQKLKGHEEDNLLISVIDLNSSQWDFENIKGIMSLDEEFIEGTGNSALVAMDDAIQLKLVIDTAAIDE